MASKKSIRLFASFLLIVLMTLTGPAILASANEPLGEYIVQKGDNLSNIAKKQLGDSNRWSEIYELNKDAIKDPSLIYKGQNLKLPEISADQKEADQCAQLLYDKSASVEPAVTALLKSMESDKAHLEGLEFKLKSVESTSRKILSDSNDMEISISEAASNIHDSLRYTFIIEDSNYIATTKNTLDTLVAKGYRIYKFKNFWASKDNPYQGINTNIEAADGLIFELQFHTPISYDTKVNKTHVYYEIIRSETTTAEEKAEAEKAETALFEMIPIPEGVEQFSYK